MPLNVIGFIIAMVFNGMAQKWAKKSLGDQSKQWDLKFQPATRAFGIWGLIYSLLFVFVVYQTLPDSWVGKNGCLNKARNNTLIYEKIGYVFFINMLFNSLWLVIFGQNALWAFILAWLVIVGMVVTQTIIMRLAIRAELNWLEFVCLRAAFSIYNGWVSAATILNTAFVIKSAEIGIFMDHEVGWTVVTIWVGFALYVTVASMEKNVIYGAVYLWVLYNVNDKSDVAVIQDHTMYALVAHTGFILGLAGYKIYT